MTHDNERSGAARTHRSAFDRRAINATGHLLLGAVALERRIASLPMQLSSLVEVARQGGSSTRLPGPVLTKTNGNES
jgi:hypothetical protein